PCFIPTELTGRYLDSARVVTDPTTGQLQIALQFDETGADLFEELTLKNIGKPIAIVLDGAVVSAPVVNNPITGGEAVITGGFTLEAARDIASNLSAGALPVPISIMSQQQIGPTLGEKSVAASLRAGIIGGLAVMVFMVLLYRLSGLVAVISLLVYISLLLALIQLIPITLTLAGIAGLILSVGMAVDANILVFERLREELKGGRENMVRAVENAFARTWPAVRDGNISTLLTAVILFYFSTSFVQGFALTLGLGVLVSMFSAMVVTRALLILIAETRLSQYKRLWTRLLRI
ncbi:MAG: protein translocase subunit SecD, partial [Candidatus Spechtbacterales bacterium]